MINFFKNIFGKKLDLDKEFKFLLNLSNKSNDLKNDLQKINEEVDNYNSTEYQSVDAELLLNQSEIDKETENAAMELQAIRRIQLKIITLLKYRIILKNKENISSDEKNWINSYDNCEKLMKDDMEGALHTIWILYEAIN